MKTKKTNLYIKLISAIVIIILLFLVYFFTSSRWTIYLRWNIMLPVGVKRIYRQTDIGFTGDGYRYYIFKYNGSETSPFFSNFSKKGNNPQEEDNMKLFLEEISEKLNISKDNYPSLNSSYIWKKKLIDSKYWDICYMLYVKQEKKLYIFESIT